MRARDRDQLARLPLLEEALLEDPRVLGVVEDAAGVVQQRAQRRAAGLGDRLVELQPALGDELQGDGRDERLGHAADAEAVARRAGCRRRRRGRRRARRRPGCPPW